MSLDLQERNIQTLNDINDLRNLEEELYNNLNNINLNEDEKQKIMNKINELLQIRINLYSTLKDYYNSFQKNVSSSRNVLSEQITAINIIENELEESKRRLKLIQEEKNNKLRLVSINTYYGKKYNAQTKIMQIIVVSCIILIILSILYTKQILPSRIYFILTAIVIIIVLFNIGSKIIDLSNRDNMNFDEYNWYFNKSYAPKNDNIMDSGETGYDPWKMTNITCIGQECCYEGSTYDNVENKCIPNI
jgi:ABC-type multidrug transport system fused ATPase/permease subunit